MSRQEFLKTGMSDMDDETRHTLTKSFLEGLRPAPSPPKDLNSLQATNLELVKNGLPSRPDKSEKPAHFAKWNRFILKSPHHIPPTFKIIKDHRNPAKKDSSSASITSGNWSGAVVMSPPAGETFNSASARWVVPNAWPPLSAWNGTGWNDGSWEQVAWVGIDGWSARNSILQAGTKSVVTVSGGKMTQSSWAWFEWLPAFEIQFSNFQVEAGDTVEVLVCAFTSTTGFAGVTNVGANTYTSTSINAPNTAAALQGQNAEWILEDDSIGGSEAPFSDYGAIFFYDCSAGSKNHEVNVSNATLVNMVEGGKTVSTAVEISPTVLMTYEGNAGP